MDWDRRIFQANPLPEKRLQNAPNSVQGRLFQPMKLNRFAHKRKAAIVTSREAQPELLAASIAKGYHVSPLTVQQHFLLFWPSFSTETVRSPEQTPPGRRQAASVCVLRFVPHICRIILACC